MLQGVAALHAKITKCDAVSHTEKILTCNCMRLVKMHFHTSRVSFFKNKKRMLIQSVSSEKMIHLMKCLAPGGVFPFEGSCFSAELGVL